MLPLFYGPDTSGISAPLDSRRASLASLTQPHRLVPMSYGVFKVKEPKVLLGAFQAPNPRRRGREGVTNMAALLCIATHDEVNYMTDLLDIPAIWRKDIANRVYQWAQPQLEDLFEHNCEGNVEDFCDSCYADLLRTLFHSEEDGHVYHLEDVTDDGPGWLCVDCEVETWVPYGVEHTHDGLRASLPPAPQAHHFEFLDHQVAHMEDAARCVNCGAESFDGSVNEFKLGCDSVNVQLYRKSRLELRQGVSK